MDLGPVLARLDEIPGIGAIAAYPILAEIGLDMSRFPTPAHLASWAGFAPGVKESAGRRQGRAGTTHGNRYPARTLGEVAIGASRTPTSLGERYRRIARRRGKKRAIVATGRPILTILWKILSDDTTRFIDLGPDYYPNKTNADRRVHNHLRGPHDLGYRVTPEPAASPKLPGHHADDSDVT